MQYSVPVPRRSFRAPAAVLLSASIAACGGGIAPLPPSPPPGPAPPSATAPAAALFRHASGERRVVIESRATVRVANDTATAQDTVRTTTWLRYRVGEGTASRTLEVTVDSVLRSAGPLLPGSAPLAQPVRFSGRLEGDRVELPLDSAAAADCTSPAGALHAVARDVLPSIPARLAPGVRWEESVTATACRGGAVLTTLARHQYHVPRDGGVGAGQFRVVRTSEIRISGSGAVGGEPIHARGEGTGGGEIFVDRSGGQVVESSSTSRIELVFSALGQEQRVVQEAEQRMRVLESRQ